MLKGNPTSVGSIKNINSLSDEIDDVDDYVDTVEAGITTLETDIAALQADIDHATHGLAALQVQIDDIQDKVDGTDAIPTALARAAGVVQIKEITVTAAANAGATSIATFTGQGLLVESVTIRAGGNNADMTSCEVRSGTAGKAVMVAAAVAIVASLNEEDEQVSGSGAWRIDAGETLVMDLQGSGATAVNLLVTVKYRAVASGGYLA